MSWVTCQSPTSNETFAVNTDNVRRVVAKGVSSVLEFLDGTAIFITHTMDEWLAAVLLTNETQPTHVIIDQQPLPQRVIQGVKEV